MCICPPAWQATQNQLHHPSCPASRLPQPRAASRQQTLPQPRGLIDWPAELASNSAVLRISRTLCLRGPQDAATLAGVLDLPLPEVEAALDLLVRDLVAVQNAFGFYEFRVRIKGLSDG